MEREFNQSTETRAVHRLVLYVFAIVFVSAVLLAINTGLVFSLAQGLSAMLPETIGLPQLIQMLIFVGPVLLLYLEWYAWDVITSRRVKSRG